MVFHNNNKQSNCKVGIIGGGVAGSTAALRLAELGIDVELFEEGKSLVNGPPICHLHAGGNLYREISDEQCATLLKQSIDTVRAYPASVNVRPTVLAVPTHDAGDPKELLPRLTMLQSLYAQLVQQDPCNSVLGNPDDYYRLYNEADITALAVLEQPLCPQTPDEWMIPVAKSINPKQFKYPIVMVQEYGLSVFRIAATVSLALAQKNNCIVHTSTKVTNLSYLADSQTWTLEFSNNSINKPQAEHFDYIVNASGFRTGTIDNLIHVKRDRLVEFKSAYVTHWQDCHAQWPEVIFHGERGTPQGMAQLTPYPNGYFQLHGMTEDITLFKDGLVHSTTTSSQPHLAASFLTKISDRWKQQEVSERTERAIAHMSQFVPSFTTATVGGMPLFGAQQIPGLNPTLRAADVSFAAQRYARSEIVKASSALSAANEIVANLIANKLIDPLNNTDIIEEEFKTNQTLSLDDVVNKAAAIAKERGYPQELAIPTGYQRAI
ncbi:FAD-dependent oxidoreductase [Photobacterium damselae subsp. piscicida]|nr:FAD-dependent oxidoreductase [Photobacterium damselae subsp. piscicida]